MIEELAKVCVSTAATLMAHTSLGSGPFYYFGNKEQKDTFTKECIDTINQNLTEKQDKFLCIVAGYEDSINECFFAYNKGLERRFPIRFNICKYNGEELYQIFMKFINKLDFRIGCIT